MNSRQSSSSARVVVLGSDQLGTEKFEGENHTMTDHLSCGKSGAERSQSGLHTVSTVTDFTDVSSIESQSVFSRAHEAASKIMGDHHSQELLMQMIAKEMVKSLLGSGNRIDEQDPSERSGSSHRRSRTPEGQHTHECSSPSSVGTHSRGMETEVIEFAEQMLRSSGDPGTDSRLRNMLRASLHSDKGIDKSDNYSEHSAVGTRESASACGSWKSFASGDASEFPQRKGKVRSSLKEDLATAPMDNRHPDFWSNVHKSPSSVDRSHSGSSSSRRNDSRSAQSNTKPPSITEFINTVTDTSDHSSSDENSWDDQTACSDITGLTGAFPDCPNDEEERSDAQNLRADSPIKAASKSSASLGSEHRRSVALSARVPGSTGGSLAPLKKKKGVIAFTVSFGTVEVRHYARIASDNPACSGGPPIGIGWEFAAGGKVDLSDWEKARRRRRPSADLQLDRRKREKILREWGYADKELALVMREMNKVKAQRRQTSNNLAAQKMEEAVEQAARKVKRLLFLKKS
jgi:hypothetical protein